MGGMEVEEKGSQREAILSTESIGIHRADVFWNEVEKLLLSEGGKWKSSELALDLVDCPKTTTSDNMYLKPQSSIALRRHGSEPVNSYDGSPFEFSLKELPSSPAFLPNEKLKTRRQSLGLELISNTEAPQVTRKRHSSQTGSRYDNSSVTVAGTAPHVQGFHSSLNSTVSLLSTGSESKGSTPWLQSFHNISDETKAALTNVLELLNVLVKRMRKSKWTLDLQEYSAEQSLTLGEFKPIKEYLDSILASLGSRAIRVVSNRLESPCWALAGTRMSQMLGFSHEILVPRKNSLNNVIAADVMITIHTTCKKFNRHQLIVANISVDILYEIDKETLSIKIVASIDENRESFPSPQSDKDTKGFETRRR